MRFSATEEQVKQIAANAVNRSKPVGTEVLHPDPTRTWLKSDLTLVFNASDFDFNLNSQGIHLEYVGGRVVGLSIVRCGGSEWEIPDNPTPDYQSWCRTYRTTQALVNSVVSAPIPAA